MPSRTVDTEFRISSKELKQLVREWATTFGITLPAENDFNVSLDGGGTPQLVVTWQQKEELVVLGSPPVVVALGPPVVSP